MTYCIRTNNKIHNFRLKMAILFAACSMVLVPARVVQALNLDVQALGLQISPRKGMLVYFLNSYYM